MANHGGTVVMLLFLVAAVAGAATAAPTAYDMLSQYGFPRGLLPVGVQDYALHPDGSFEVSVVSGAGGGSCEIYVAGFALRYGSHVRGNVRSMAIEKLEGVSVKVAIKWVGIDDVKRDGDRLVFEAGMGMLSKSFSIANFAESPRCKPLPELAEMNH